MAFLAGAATAVIAGGYFLYGPQGRRHRWQTERFIEDTKSRILERMEGARDLSQDAYNRIVDEVVSDTDLAKRLGRAKAMRLAQKFKTRWQEMRAKAQQAADQAELELALEDEE